MDWTLIDHHFRLPIRYLPDDQVRRLSEDTIRELELIDRIESENGEDKEEEERVPLLDRLFLPSHNAAKQVVRQWGQHYTTSIPFLTDTQRLLEHVRKQDDDVFAASTQGGWSDQHPLMTLWKECCRNHELEVGFRETYNYVEWECLDFLNQNEVYLLASGMHTIVSPLVTLVMPILLFLAPFFILLYVWKVPVTWQQYWVVFATVAQRNAIGKLLYANYAQLSWGQIIYLLLSAALYIYSCYQSVVTCIRFVTNREKMYQMISCLHTHWSVTLRQMKRLEDIVDRDKLSSYEPFLSHMDRQRDQIRHWVQEMEPLTTPRTSIYAHCVSWLDIGRAMRLFYRMHTDSELEPLLAYSLGFHGYLDNLHHLARQPLGQAVYTRPQPTTTKEGEEEISSPSLELQGVYYPALHGSPTVVPNDIHLSQNVILTGPNASGKTTVLKSVWLAIFMAQSMGVGCFAGATVTPFHQLHCYLNVPDTSGRDSLFQAEARRCKQMLTAFEQCPDERHFCMFDELYSGTNPEDAEVSTTAFMRFVDQCPRVRCMLTTHFVDVCEPLAQTTHIVNWKMQCHALDDGTMSYTYRVMPGISTQKGAVSVLRNLDYPDAILHDIATQRQDLPFTHGEEEEEKENNTLAETI